MSHETSVRAEFEKAWAKYFPLPTPQSVGEESLQDQAKLKGWIFWQAAYAAGMATLTPVEIAGTETYKALWADRDRVEKEYAQRVETAEAELAALRKERDALRDDERLSIELAIEVWSCWHGPMARIPGTHDQCAQELLEMIKRARTALESTGKND